ncbi:PREDICTED: scavenger receptor class F member 2-like, partial [Condylura cristata]|uniref:scavenger receptor class F member 2-like n=1 Tax=Condylura cristata TaxID=143302 RepID=UPI000643A18A
EYRAVRGRKEPRTGKPWICRSAPRDACSVHSAWPLPGASTSWQGAGDLSSTTASGSRRPERGRGLSGAPGPAGWRAELPWRRGRSRAQVPGSGFATRPLLSALRLRPHNHHPGPRATVAARGRLSSAKDPHPGGRLCSAHRPSPPHRAKEKPAPGSRILAAPQSRSSLNYSQSGGSTSGRPQETSATSSLPLGWGHPTPHQTHQRAQRCGPPDTFQVPTARSEPSGPAGRTGLAELVCREAGRKEESDRKSHSSSLPASKNVAGSAAGRDARRRTLRSPERAARLVPCPEEPNAKSPNWRRQ